MRVPQKSAPPKRGKGLAMMFARRDLPIPPQTSKFAISQFVPSDSRLVAAALSLYRRRLFKDFEPMFAHPCAEGGPLGCKSTLVT